MPATRAAPSRVYTARQLFAVAAQAPIPVAAIQPTTIGDCQPRPRPTGAPMAARAAAAEAVSSP